MTYYKQRPASELPTKSGKYLTDLGFVHFIMRGTQESTESYWFVIPEFWLEPVELPIEPNVMTLEEAKDITAILHGYINWADFYIKDYIRAVEKGANEAAELYLSSNTAALKEERDEMERNAIENLTEARRQKGFVADMISEKEFLEQQVKTLYEALEIAQQYVNVFMIRGEEPLAGENLKDDSYKIITALETINK